MRSSAIIRIIIFSIVIILLLGILGVGLGFGSFIVDFGYYSESYTTGGNSLPADDIKNISVEWAAGSITIEPSDNPADSDSIYFIEEGFTTQETEMVYSLEGNTLSIRYSKPGFMIGFVSTPVKNLTVKVPADWVCGELSIDAAATDVRIYALTAEEVDMDSASGICRFENCSFGDLDIDTASGDIEFIGSLTTLECDAASADITAQFITAPNRISIDGVSGRLTITLPQECGFSVSMDSLSGTFSSDFAVMKKNDDYVFGDGACRIDTSTVSGDIEIKKATS